MRSLHVKWAVLALCLGFAACAVATPPQKDEEVGLSDNALVSEGGCPGRHPPMRGCRVPCKPCSIAECVDGEWTYERIEWDGCDPDPLPGPSCCQADFSGGCPAECHCCDYN